MHPLMDRLQGKAFQYYNQIIVDYLKERAEWADEKLGVPYKTLLLILELSPKVDKICKVCGHSIDCDCYPTEEIKPNEVKLEIMKMPHYGYDLANKDWEKIIKEVWALIKPSEGLNINCDKCGEKITEQGALLFSPPDENGECIKEHICKDCYEIA